MILILKWFIFRSSCCRQSFYGETQKEPAQI